MYVGVNLDAQTRQQGVRPPPKPPPHLDLPESPDDAKKGASARRSQSFGPPSNRLTQPTKASRGRANLVTGATSASPFSARSMGSEKKQTPQSARSSRSPSARSPSARSPFAATGSSTSRSRPPTYSARLSAHEKTHSPSGRYHPDSLRRREIRSVDMHTDIDYFAAGGAPDNDRRMKEQSWLCSQAFIESLRVYPDPFEKRPVALPGESIAFSGNTQSARRPHTEHVETAMRRRLSIAPADAEWLEEQLPQRWPFNIAEGEWRSVGPLKKGDAAVAMSRQMGRSRSAGALTGRSQLGYPTGGTPQSSARRAGEESGISPAGTALFNR